MLMRVFTTPPPPPPPPWSFILYTSSRERALPGAAQRAWLTVWCFQRFTCPPPRCSDAQHSQLDFRKRSAAAVSGWIIQRSLRCRRDVQHLLYRLQKLCLHINVRVIFITDVIISIQVPCLLFPEYCSYAEQGRLFLNLYLQFVRIGLLLFPVIVSTVSCLTLQSVNVVYTSSHT